MTNRKLFCFTKKWIKKSIETLWFIPWVVKYLPSEIWGVTKMTIQDAIFVVKHHVNFKADKIDEALAILVAFAERKLEKETKRKE